jgi:hypothetical protein
MLEFILWADVGLPVDVGLGCSGNTEHRPDRGLCFLGLSYVSWYLKRDNGIRYWGKELAARISD